MRLTDIPGIILVLALIGGSIAVVANMLALIMVGKTNEKVPEGEKISYIWWDRRVLKRYAALYPDSKLPLLFRCLEASLLLAFLAMMWAFYSRVWFAS